MSKIITEREQQIEIMDGKIQNTFSLPFMEARKLKKEFGYNRLPIDYKTQIINKPKRGNEFFGVVDMLPVWEGFIPWDTLVLRTPNQTPPPDFTLNIYIYTNEYGWIRDWQWV